MKVSDQQGKFTESYVVDFWHKLNNGFYVSEKRTYWSNSRSAHKEVEKIALKALSKILKDVKISSVTYQ